MNYITTKLPTSDHPVTIKCSDGTIDFFSRELLLESSGVIRELDRDPNVKIIEIHVSVELLIIVLDIIYRPSNILTMSKNKFARLFTTDNFKEMIDFAVSYGFESVVKTIENIIIKYIDGSKVINRTSTMIFCEWGMYDFIALNARYISPLFDNYDSMIEITYVSDNPDKSVTWYTEVDPPKAEDLYRLLPKEVFIELWKYERSKNNYVVKSIQSGQ